MASPKVVEKTAKRSTKETEKREKVEGDGLCMTCNNEPTCVHNASRGPVMYCEEYDGYAEAPRIEPIPVEKKGNGKTKKQYKGLCVNCDHNAECVNAATEGGVWHCEEYR